MYTHTTIVCISDSYSKLVNKILVEEQISQTVAIPLNFSMYQNVKGLTLITHVHSSSQKYGFHKPVIGILMIFK